VVDGRGGGWVDGRLVRDQEPPRDLGTVTRTTVRGKIEKQKRATKHVVVRIEHSLRTRKSRNKQRVPQPSGTTLAAIECLECDGPSIGTRPVVPNEAYTHTTYHTIPIPLPFTPLQPHTLDRATVGQCAQNKTMNS